MTIPKDVLDRFRDSSQLNYRGSPDFTYADAIAFAMQGKAQWDVVCQWMHGIDECRAMRPDIYANAAVGLLHAALDLTGFIPIVGEAADGLNTLVYLAEGDTVNAGISAAGLLPVVGDIGKAAARYGDDVVGLFKTACSFTGNTPVLLADGTTKPISQIKVGDQVLATDPRPVTTARAP